MLASAASGHDEYGAAVRLQPMAASVQQGTMAESVGRDRRIILKDIEFTVTGQSATATVGLMLEDRLATGRAVARTGEDIQLQLPAEAAVRAISEFLPPGHGVVLEHVRPISSETEQAVWAKVLLLTPKGEQTLLGIAGVGNDGPGAAVRAVLGAVNRRIALLFDQA